MKEFSSTEDLPPNGDIDEIADHISKMSPEKLRLLVEQRLRGLETEVLPQLERDEDPADILIDCFAKYPDKLASLQDVCTELAYAWSEQKDEEIKANPEPLGELLYMCAMLHARSALPAIAHIADRANLASAILPEGEDIQSRALRSLAGLLVSEPPKVRDEYRKLFEVALETVDHAPIGLTTLTTFYPSERDTFIAKAQIHKLEEHGEVAWVIENLDMFVESTPD